MVDVKISAVCGLQIICDNDLEDIKWFRSRSKYMCHGIVEVVAGLV